MSREAADGPERAIGPARCREFRLSDAMILVAGMTLWLSMGPYLFGHLSTAFVDLCRRTAEHRADLWEHWPVFWVAIRRSLAWTLSCLDQLLRNLLVGMALAFLALRAIRPRPPLPGLLRQPGTVAVLAMIFGALWIAGFLTYLFYPTVGSGQRISLDPRLSSSLAIGGSVTVAWAILALGRRWQAEPGWIDRMGRWLGVGAIVHMGLSLLEFVVIPLAW